MNYLWGGMILIGIVYGTFTGNMQQITDAVLASSREAVSLCISMAGILAFWSGLMEIASECGILSGLTRKLKPFIHFLFPELPPGHIAEKYLSTNIIANFLGLGWAATPAGLKAMEELQKLKEKRGEISRNAASNEMCTFLILNISSLQLIPVNIIAYRSQYGSINPTAIVGPGIAATAVSTMVAVVFCKVMDSQKQKFL